MHLNLFPYSVLWCILAMVILCLIVYRKTIARQEDDSIHLESDVSAKQNIVDHKLTAIDRWGQGLTVVAVVYGALIAGLYLYQAWTTVPSY